MGESLRHECGIALVRLLKPLTYYIKKYGTPLYGFNKLFMLMEKQHNRGQDGTGIGCVKLDVAAGKKYMFRNRNCEGNSLQKLVWEQLSHYRTLENKELIDSTTGAGVKDHWDYGAEVLLGHVRYATSGHWGVENCHPYVRRSNWPTRNLMLAGNFNLTNSDKLNEEMVSKGQHPIFATDTQVILEAIGHQLDEEHSRIYHEMRGKKLHDEDIPKIISQHLDPAQILAKATANWDGGYTIAGLIGNGDAFVMRDAVGIRPGWYFKNDEIVAVASERVALMTIFGVSAQQVHEIKRGHALVIKHFGEVYERPYTEEQKEQGCSFERIYFSRGNDPDIYRERKALGVTLVHPILKEVNYDYENTIFSYVPNTAEAAYYGLMDGLREARREHVKATILKAHLERTLNEEMIDELILKGWPRREKIAIKDIKLRTFISQEESRLQVASYMYDITYGAVLPTDNLVCIDDSIVRGTTLKQSILKILSRTQPKKIVIGSTAPQIRYPDCYGIDMSELGKFVAFQAAIALLTEQGKSSLIDEVYERCKKEEKKKTPIKTNSVRQLYDALSEEEISKKIAELVFPERENWNGELAIVFQSIEGLRQCLGERRGDWYFTGNYPTPGGYTVLNRAFINYYENRLGRSY